jgi:hypothetical protein
MSTEDKESELTMNFEKRRHPRFNVNLPIEYSQTGLFLRQGRAISASEGGIVSLPEEKMEIGQHLMLELFLPSGPELNRI